MEKTSIILVLTALAIAAMAAVAYAAARPSFAGVGTADRPDCPGKIRCPITGEMVCRDQCPRIDANRPDCPGKIECPQTGELVCKDRCPLTSAVSVDTDVQAPRACCRADNS